MHYNEILKESTSSQPEKKRTLLELQQEVQQKELQIQSQDQQITALRNSLHINLIAIKSLELVIRSSTEAKADKPEPQPEEPIAAQTEVPDDAVTPEQRTAIPCYLRFAVPAILTLLAALFSPGFREDICGCWEMAAAVHEMVLAMLDGIAALFDPEASELMVTLAATALGIGLFAGVWAAIQHIRKNAAVFFPPTFLKVLPFIPAVFLVTDIVKMVLPLNLILTTGVLLIGFSAINAMKDRNAAL